MKTSRITASFHIAAQLSALAAALAALTLVAVIAAPMLALGRRLLAWWRPPTQPSAVVGYGCSSAAAAGHAAAVAVMANSMARGATPTVDAAGVVADDGGADAANDAGVDAVEGGLCVICLDGHGADPTVLACSHAYHPGCIDSWLTVRASCPLCAAEVTAGPSLQRVATNVSREGSLVRLVE